MPQNLIIIKKELFANFSTITFLWDSGAGNKQIDYYNIEIDWPLSKQLTLLILPIPLLAYQRSPIMKTSPSCLQLIIALVPVLKVYLILLLVSPIML